MSSVAVQFCPACGKPLDEVKSKGKFCPYCGRSLSDLTPEETPVYDNNYIISPSGYSFFEWFSKSWNQYFSGGRKFGFVIGFLTLFLFGIVYIGAAIYFILTGYTGPEPLMLFLGYCFICSFLVITIPLSDEKKHPPHCASCGKTDNTLKYYNYKNMQPRIICDNCNSGKMKFILVGHSWTANFWLGPFSFIFWIVDMIKSFSQKAVDQQKTAKLITDIKTLSSQQTIKAINQKKTSDSPGVIVQSKMMKPDYQTMQDIRVSFFTAKYNGNLAGMKDAANLLLRNYPEEPDSYLGAAEAYIINEVSGEAHALAGNYQKVIDYCETGLKKIGNEGYMKFNNGDRNSTEGNLYYYLAKAIYLERSYGKNVKSYSRSLAEDYALKAHRLLNSEDSLKLYQIIAGL